MALFVMSSRVRVRAEPPVGSLMTMFWEPSDDLAGLETWVLA